MYRGRDQDDYRHTVHEINGDDYDDDFNASDDDGGGGDDDNDDANSNNKILKLLKL